MRRDNNLIFFLVFFTLTFIIILGGVSGKFISDIFWNVKNVFSISKNQTGEVVKLKEENADLRKKAIDTQNLITENKALRDQFSTSPISNNNLIPAKVVGSPGFIPGVTNPDYLVIDKGEKDGLKINDAVIYKNNFVGKVVGLSGNFSKVQIVLNINSFTAKVLGERQINGVVKGRGNILILDNVLLSEVLKKDQMVLTKGEIDENGIGILPDLVVGKIISIEKKSSELFQRAEVKSLLDFNNLSTVFVIKK